MEDGAEGLAFKVIKPDGETFRIFADGRVEGFGDDVVVVNYVPLLVLSAITPKDGTNGV